MTPLIKILIISDDIEKWLSFFRGCLVVKNKNNITIRGGWFYINLRSRIHENARGEKFDKIIVDKIIPDEILSTVIAPMVNISKITYTKEEYRFGKETIE